MNVLPAAAATIPPLVRVVKSKQKLAVLATPEVRQLFAHEPEVTAGGFPYRIVPHAQAEVAILRRLGYPAGNPMLEYYDWPGRPDHPPFQVQKTTCDLLTLNQRAYVLNDMGCVDGDTEYLAEDGWHRIADYRAGKVAQYHPDTEHIEFVEPTKYVKLPCPEMIRFKTARGVDQLLSPEHGVLLADGTVLRAEEVEEIYITGTQAQRKRIRFRTTFKVTGTVGFPLTDQQIRVQVAVNADGYERIDWDKITVRLKKQRKIYRLRMLLTDAGIPFKETPCLPAGFKRFTFIPPWKKGFGAAWWLATQHQLEVVALEVVHWDGSQRKALGQSFSSTNKSDADFVQYAYSASGKRTSLKTKYRADRNHTDHVVYAGVHHGPTAGLYGANGGVIRPNVWREPSTDGFKYCFMVPSTFLLLRRNGNIFATKNTGKTKAALWAWDWLKTQGLSSKLLITAPLSTLKFVWLSELFQTIPHRKATVLHGSKLDRLEKLADPENEVFIINHDGIGVIFDELMVRTDIDALLIDELATFRNTNARSKKLRRLAQTKKIVWGMTGSPMPVEPPDVWMQCQIVTPATVPKYQSHMRDALMERKNQFVWIPKEGAIEKAFSYMQPSVRFNLNDVTELPDVIERTIDIDMTPEQKRVYKGMVDKCVALVQSKQINAANAAVAMGKLIQIAGGWVYAGDQEVATLDAGPRVQALLDTIAGCSRKVIVFAPYRHAVAGIAQILATEKIPFREVPDHGDREAVFNEFQNGTSFNVLLSHPRKMSHGLTLTAASTIVWYLPVLSLETYEQANARIRRVGQKFKQEVIHLVASPVERRIYTMLRSRQKLQDKFLGLFENATTALHLLGR